MRFPPLLPTYSPSWMWPKTCSRGWTRLWTVLSSSTQPTRCIFLGTQSRKPVGEDKALRGTAGHLAPRASISIDWVGLEAMPQPQHRSPLPVQQAPEPCPASEKSPVTTQLLEAQSLFLDRAKRLLSKSPWEARHLGPGAYNHYSSRPVAAAGAI